MTTHQDEQIDRRRTLAYDLRVRNQTASDEASTFRTFAEADANQARGRYSAELATTVIGATPIPKYPELPSGPWSGQDPVPDEPPLGFSVPRPEPIVASPLVRATPKPTVTSTPLDAERVGLGGLSSDGPVLGRTPASAGTTASTDALLEHRTVAPLHRRF
jgi:hypothetical protein